jgi:hypothetical protein
MELFPPQEHGEVGNVARIGQGKRTDLELLSNEQKLPSKGGHSQARLATRIKKERPAIAERKMGEMLRETERANAARDKKKAELPDVTPPPTLADLGVSKKESTQGSDRGT